MLNRTFIPLFLFLLSFAIPFPGSAQGERTDTSNGNELVQFSGVVVRNDSLTPVPYTNIIIKNTSHGTVADNNGYFSFVAKEGDTVLFSALGFKRSHFILPDSLKDHQYSLIHVMERDTVQLKETVIYPWPTKEQFKQAFLNADIPDDDLERARENLAQEKLRKRYEEMPMDGSMNYSFEMQEYQNKIYHAGQAPPISLLNPAAWAKFIKAWREGKFTNQGNE